MSCYTIIHKPDRLANRCIIDVGMTVLNVNAVNTMTTICGKIKAATNRRWTLLGVANLTHKSWLADWALRMHTAGGVLCYVILRNYTRARAFLKVRMRIALPFTSKRDLVCCRVYKNTLKTFGKKLSKMDYFWSTLSNSGYLTLYIIGALALVLVVLVFLFFTAYLHYVHWKYSHLPQPKRPRYIPWRNKYMEP